jgi:CRISPR/Cas system-associated protein Cas10 (large subunit of type III CRISPR-Cas system)
MSEDRNEDIREGISVEIPLDEDDFVLRECPACEREFRRHVSADDDEGVSPPPSGYFCPYCGKQASPDSWFTKAQADFLSATAIHQVVGPELDEILGGFAKDSPSLKIEVTGSVSEEKPAPLEEDLDAETRRVKFSCHPTEPIKVDPDWEDDVHCLICGARGR